MVRDSKHQSVLKAMGWNVLVIWECEVNILGILEGKIDGFLSSEKGA
jgi:G:T-mismatch repair DNA endonuclease (very short patch repair protein)